MATNAPKPQNEHGVTLEPDTILSATPRLAADRSSLKPEEQLLVALADGRGPVSEILRLSGMSGSVTMRFLRSLCDRGFLQEVARPAGEKTAAGSTTLVMHAQGPAATQDLTELVGRTGHGRGAGAPPVDELVPHKSAAAAGATPAPALSKATFIGMEPVAAPRKPSTRPVTSVAPATVPPSERAAPVSAAGVIDAPTASAPPAAHEQPTRVGAYQVVARMGQGGVASVYLGRRVGSRRFQRLFALKVIREHSAEAETAAQSLWREARVGTLVSHPNVLSVVDVGQYQDQPFLLMDYVEGTSLAELMMEGTPCPPSLIVPVLLDVLRGLQYLHELRDPDGRSLGLVHCDLSPPNILIGTDGAARLADLGSARFTALPEDRAFDTAMLKPAYAAPEQLKGEPVDGRTDIFALGVVLWTALTGKVLFAESNYEQTVMNVLRRPVQPPSALGAPASLDEICLKALNRNRAGRYQSAEEMATALIKVGAAEGYLPGARAISLWVRQAVSDVLVDRRARLEEIASGSIEPVVVTTESVSPVPGHRSDGVGATQQIEVARPAAGRATVQLDMGRLPSRGTREADRATMMIDPVRPRRGKPLAETPDKIEPSTVSSSRVRPAATVDDSDALSAPNSRRRKPGLLRKMFPFLYRSDFDFDEDEEYAGVDGFDPSSKTQDDN